MPADRDVQLRRCDLFQPIETERKPDCGEIFAKGGGQAVVSAAAGDFKSQLRNVGAKQNARVVVEAAHLAKVDGQVTRETEPVEYRMDFFEVIESLDGSRISNQASRFLENFAAAGQMRDGAKDILATFFQWQRMQKRFQSRLILEIENLLSFVI